MSIRLSEKAFVDAVLEALRGVPQQFADWLENVAVQACTHVPDWIVQEIGDESARDELLGYYVGTPITEQSVEGGAISPHCVYIFQRNLESMCDDRDELLEEIRITVLHEIGHHMGLDEDDLARMGLD